MEDIRNYKIKFAGLKNGKHNFDFDIEQEFFQLFGAEQEFDHAKLKADVTLDKHTTFLEFKIKISGTVDLVCDISSEEFEYPLNTEIEIQVKFGDTFNDDNDEIIIIPHNEMDFNIAQLIYEAVSLAIPMKKISPNVSEESLQLLEQYSPKEKDTSEIDPRWSALQQLKDKE